MSLIYLPTVSKPQIKILRSSAYIDIDAFENHINKYLIEGWSMSGVMSSQGNTLTQVMIKEVELEQK